MRIHGFQLLSYLVAFFSVPVKSRFSFVKIHMFVLKYSMISLSREPGLSPALHHPCLGCEVTAVYTLV